MASSRRKSEVPIFNVNSNTQFLKQWTSVVETTVNRNITKQTELREKGDSEQAKQRQEKKRQLLLRIQEAENKKVELQRQNQVYQQQLKDLAEKDREKIEKVKLEIEESKKLVRELQESDVATNEFLSFYGTMASESLKLDWKKEVGVVLCPEGKVVVASPKSNQECDFWNCPAILPK